MMDYASDDFQVQNILTAQHSNSTSFWHVP